MEIDHKTKTILVTKEYINGFFHRFNPKYENVNTITKRLIKPQIDEGYKVVYKTGKRRILMLYNK
jgi:hypothetical protein